MNIQQNRKKSKLGYLIVTIPKSDYDTKENKFYILFQKSWKHFIPLRN